MLSLNRRHITELEQVSVDYFSGGWYISIIHGHKFSSAFIPLSFFCSPTEKISVICSSREKKIYHTYNFLSNHFLFLYNVLHLDRKCRESHLSLSLNHFVQTLIKVDMKRKFLFCHIEVHEKQEWTLLTVFWYLIWFQRYLRLKGRNMTLKIGSLETTTTVKIMMSSGLHVDHCVIRLTIAL